MSVASPRRLLAVRDADVTQYPGDRVGPYLRGPPARPSPGARRYGVPRRIGRRVGSRREHGGNPEARLLLMILVLGSVFTELRRSSMRSGEGSGSLHRTCWVSTGGLHRLEGTSWSSRSLRASSSPCCRSDARTRRSPRVSRHARHRHRGRCRHGGQLHAGLGPVRIPTDSRCRTSCPRHRHDGPGRVLGAIPLRFSNLLELVG